MERMLNPVALTAPHPKCEPIHPPSIAPTMPSATVIRQPAGSRPGIKYFESVPAMRPSTIQCSQRGMMERNANGLARACRAIGPGVVSCYRDLATDPYDGASNLHRIFRNSCPRLYLNALHTVGWSAISADRG